ncbi:MAG: hypothetical protein QG650_822 [Patescibacteria group bacterium]|nr:hypothetical protein [Patescibacteria group bacterium]
MDFNKIVKKLSKSPSKVFDLEDIAEFVDPGFARGEGGKRDAYKLVYRLKSQGILMPIRNGLYQRTDDPYEKDPYDDVRAVEDAYWKIVKKLITKNCGANYVVAGSKALEIRMRDLSIPDTLIVYTKDLTSVLTVSERHRVVFQMAKTGAKTGRNNAFPVFAEFAETFEIDGLKFKIAGIEHAILDALIVHKRTPADTYAVTKFVSKYSKAVRRDALGKLVACKYLTAINRLREIARDKGDSVLYEKALDVVKREGGNCFVSGGNR